MEHQNVINLLEMRLHQSVSFTSERLAAIESSRKHIEELEGQNVESAKTVAELRSALAILRGINDVGTRG